MKPSIASPFAIVDVDERQRLWINKALCNIAIAIKLIAKINNTTAFDVWMLQLWSNKCKTLLFVIQQQLNDLLLLIILARMAEIWLCSSSTTK
jgi:hypothetical protein